jgi:hypothetical protein
MLNAASNHLKIIRTKLTTILIASLLVATTIRVQSADIPNADDTARFLAGMKPSASSPLARLAESFAAKQHASLFDSAFGKLEAQQLIKIREWSSVNLTSPRPMMYYLFSGPDFLYANSFFPHATTYLFSGLEPVGQIPNLTKLPQETVGQTLQNIQVSLHSILSLSYFITAHMRTDLNSGPVSGTLPILYVFLARSGKEIHDVSRVYLDENGSLQPGDDVRLKSTARGVKIVFSAGDGQPKTLYYFSTNVADEYHGQYALLKFGRQFNRGDSFLKSASYLLHRGSFSQARNFLLDQSAMILQDDSGIPLASFEIGKWFLHPFGRYTTPLNMFQEHYQPRLTDLYQRKHPGAMDFNLGYSSRFNGSNLLMALRNLGARDLVAFGSMDATRHDKIDHRTVLKKPAFPAHARTPRNEDEREIY